MITLENEGTNSHPLGPLLFSETVWHWIELERYPVPSLSLVDEGDILPPLPKEPKCRLPGTQYTASQKPFTHLSPVLWDLQQAGIFGVTESDCV